MRVPDLSPDLLRCSAALGTFRLTAGPPGGQERSEGRQSPRLDGDGSTNKRTSEAGVVQLEQGTGRDGTGRSNCPEEHTLPLAWAPCGAGLPQKQPTVEAACIVLT